MKSLTFRSLLFVAIDFAAACSVVSFYAAFELAHLEELIGRHLWPDNFVGKLPVLKFVIAALGIPMALGHFWLLIRYSMRIIVPLQNDHPRIYTAIARYHFWIAAGIVLLIWGLQAIVDHMILAV